MVNIRKVNLSSKSEVNAFIQVSFDLYANHPQWVPPFITDIRTMMNPNKHPYYEHSDAEFFIAEKDGKAVGRIAALENKPFNRYHEAKECGSFIYLSVLTTSKWQMRVFVDGI